MKLYITLFIPFILNCSTLQYNYNSTSISNSFIRYGIKQQSVVVVFPIIQDNTKSVGSRTTFDIRADITTSSVTGTGSNKNIRYVMPNGFILGFKYKF